MASDACADTFRLALDDQRWGAVVNRDPAADGLFFYGVVTTGVFCRPSCPARLPRRDNVRFFQTYEEASRAGFRPCLRCRPAGDSIAAGQAAAVARACRLIEQADTAPSVGDLAASAGLSRFHFHRLFKALTGVTPKAYAEAHRIGRVREGIRQSPTITEAIYGAGFGSNGRFYAVTNNRLGMTPRQFRAGGLGAAIRFAVGQCSLGGILVAATEKGVCAIMLGDDPNALVRELQDRFPAATLTGGDAAFERLVAQAVAMVESPGQSTSLPLDVRGTAFQEGVWQALREIPAGSTVSYSEIARRVGAPKAVRAVARACSANPVAVAIPCHRVVRTDGDVSGYRWGIDRKRALLAKERAS
ncbi:MAG: bifunctional DNA-binding transcriptional regulator/O6-methylguanine-DNA methyltransferase Ada [Acetobacteraceae bacterium]|nr:bifunctional DNA-binding transcriptional regulator/O6-methylguanine-DNA methyltransferase Ada [Acetobacteraceae bacterium]